jgi:arginine decarboxylase
MIGRQAAAPDRDARTLSAQDSRVLPIGVHAAAGHGRTLLSAFDAALLGAGVANYNLVRLSSVIPRQAVIEREPGPVTGAHGDRLYCVYAAAYADRPGASAWAGIGWVRDEEGNGLFVEHETGSEEELMELIHLSLDDMNRNRGGHYGPVETAVVSAHYEDEPACALVVASYAVASWDEFGIEIGVGTAAR